MRKRRALMIGVVLGSSLLALTACSKFDTSTTDAPEVETTSEYSNMRDRQDPTESTEDLLSTDNTADKAVQIISDLSDKTKQQALEQMKSGFQRINAKVAFTSTTSTDIIQSYLEKVNLTMEELAELTPEEFYNKLKEAGFTDEQIYTYSVMSYILQAYDTGDTNEPANYLSNTRELLKLNGYELDQMMKFRTVDELYTYIASGGNGESKLSVEELNAKLYFNSMFPGVDIDAQKILKATSIDEILDELSKNKLDADVLRDKSNKSNPSSNDFVEKVDEATKQKEKENAAKETTSASSGGGSGSSGGKTSALDKVTAPTLPDGAEDLIVSVQIAGEGGYTSSYTTDGTKNTNTSGTASIHVGDKLSKAKIVVKRIVRGSEAEGIVSQSNSVLPGNFSTDLPDDYDMVAVKFTVTLENKEENTEGITAPYVRVKNLSGSNIESVATRVFLIQPEEEDYSDSSKTKTYWVAFMIPDTQKTFALYFGDINGGNGGTSYVFKSSAIKVEDDD